MLHCSFRKKSGFLTKEQTASSLPMKNGCSSFWNSCCPMPSNTQLPVRLRFLLIRTRRFCPSLTPESVSHRKICRESLNVDLQVTTGMKICTPLASVCICAGKQRISCTIASGSNPNRVLAVAFMWNCLRDSLQSNSAWSYGSNGTLWLRQNGLRKVMKVGHRTVSNNLTKM